MKKTISLFRIPSTAFLFGFILMSLSSCDSQAAYKEDTTSTCIEEVHLQKLDFKKLQQMPILESLHLTGRVEVNPNALVPFMSMLSGLITNTYFSIGDAVAKGQVLAEIQSAELGAFQNEQKLNQSYLLLAEQDLEKIEARFAKGFSSKLELLEAEAEVENLKNTLVSIAQNLSLYSETSRQGIFQIKAPISGYIIEKRINSGQRIAAESDPLFVVADLEYVWVVANLYAGDVSKVRQGDAVQIESIAYPDTRFNGSIASIAQVFDSEGQVLKARIPIKNSEQKLIPGALVDVYLESERGEPVNAVETSAVLFDNNSYKLVLYKDACNIRIMEITPVSQNPNYTYFKEAIDMSEYYVSKNQLLIYTHLTELY